MNALTVALRVAAAWRLTKLVTEDEITRELREAVENRWPGSKAAYLVSCPACVSVWSGIAVQFLPPAVTGALAASAGTLAAKWVAEVTEETIAQ